MAIETLKTVIINNGVFKTQTFGCGKNGGAVDLPTIKSEQDIIKGDLWDTDKNEFL